MSSSSASTPTPKYKEVSLKVDEKGSKAEGPCSSCGRSNSCYRPGHGSRLCDICIERPDSKHISMQSVRERYYEKSSIDISKLSSQQQYDQFPFKDWQTAVSNKLIHSIPYTSLQKGPGKKIPYGYRLSDVDEWIKSYHYRQRQLQEELSRQREEQRRRMQRR